MSFFLSGLYSASPSPCGGEGAASGPNGRVVPLYMIATSRTEQNFLKFFLVYSTYNLPVVLDHITYRIVKV
jgi:hypothetical protein